MDRFQRALFIFRRDLRLADNRGLIAACQAADEVILAFIFTPEQIAHNPYRSDRCLQFMIESLEELESEIAARQGQLYLFYAQPEEIVARCILQLHVQAVFVNADYTPYSTSRDQKIAQTCQQQAVYFQSVHDLLLHPPSETLKRDGTPYKVFTPFFRHASKLKVAQPELSDGGRYYAQPISFAENRSLYHRILPHRQSQAAGGRKAALRILAQVRQFAEYVQQRNIPAQDHTTHLSPHLKFNTCSIREVYQAMAAELGAASELLRSLYWREFFTLVGWHFPQVFTEPFKPQVAYVSAEGSAQRFELWCAAQTGFPIIDAGMREMQATGYMHNRVRMLVAGFLIKDLHVDWRWGEKYFAQKLIDYDPAVNNGNWQWCAGTGCDAQPYYRIFNPWIQARKFDSDAGYIKRWLPELQTLPSAVIHQWYLSKHQRLCRAYPPPMVDHAEASLSARLRPSALLIGPAEHIAQGLSGDLSADEGD